MAAEIRIETNEPDIDGEHKTYDLRIECDGLYYWKIGVTGKRITQRFSKEPSSTIITVRQLWRHKSEIKAASHEEKLFRRYKGSRPFIGKMGPLIGGGNTEVFSHDAINGEPPQATFLAHVIGPDGWGETHRCYVDYDPYSQWHTQYGWIPALIQPQFDAYLIREKSNERKIIVCSVDYLEKLFPYQGHVCSQISRRVAEKALDEALWVISYADAYQEILNPRFQPSLGWG